MKKLFALVGLSLILFTEVALANSGSAVIPGLRFVNLLATDRVVPALVVSNITNKAMTIKVSFYAEDGALVIDADPSQTSGIIQTYGATVSDYDETDQKHSVKFTLDGRNTVRVQLNGDFTQQYGYGLIEWSQSNQPNVTGVVAHMHTLWQDSVTGGVIGTPINGGLPF